MHLLMRSVLALKLMHLLAAGKCAQACILLSPTAEVCTDAPMLNSAQADMTLPTAATSTACIDCKLKITGQRRGGEGRGAIGGGLGSKG